MRAALADSTRTTYGTGQHRYLEFAAEYGFIPFPVREDNLIFWVTSMGDEGLRHSSIRGYLSAVRKMQLELGGCDSIGTFEHLKRALMGLRRFAGAPVRPERLPLTATQLRLILPHLHLHVHADALIWCAMCLGVFCLLRPGEISVTAPSKEFFRATTLRWCDFTINQDGNSLRVQLRKSKTDQFRAGHTFEVGATGDSVCAVAAFKNFQRVSILTFGGIRGTEPVFTFCDGVVLTYPSFLSLIRALLGAAGLNPSLYGAHSLRVGGASMIANIGAREHEIRSAGRWKGDSSKLYTRTVRESMVGLAARMVDGQQ